MLLKALCECSGAPGGEKEVRQYIAAELERIGCPYEIDNLGNVIAHHPGKSGKQKVLFAAHMDEPALMICDVTERGFLRFKVVGTRVTPRQLSGRTVRVGENVMGVVGFAPYHMMRITDEQKRRSAENQHIDIAAESKERALERIQIGDYAVVDSPFIEMGENCKGRAMDSRLGCCAVLELLREAPDKAFDVVFTTMYEVGQRGMEVAAYTQQPDLVVSIGAVPATDIPGSLNKEGRVELGQGVCMALTDAGFAYPRNTVEAWSKAAKEAGIKSRVVQYAPDAAQAGYAALCRNGALALSLLIPCRTPAAPAGIMKKSDLNEAVAMLKLIAEKC